MKRAKRKALAGTSHVRQLASLLALGCILPAHETIAEFDVTPSLEVKAVHDDNIFIVPRGEQADQFVRLTPGIALGYTSPENALSLDANYIQDAEYYQDNKQLDSAKMRQIGTATAEYRVNERFSLGVNGAYVTTPASGELNVATGLQLGRVAAESRSWGAFSSYRASPTLSGTLQYNLSRNIIGDSAIRNVVPDSATGTGTGTGAAPDLTPGVIAAVGGDTEETGIRVDKELSPTNTLLTAYTYRTYDFDNGVDEYSHTPTVGWFHQISGATSFRVQAGPRIFSDTVEPDIYALVTHELPAGEIELSYTRTESVLAGVVGKVESEMADVEFDWQRSAKLRFNGGLNYGTIKQEQSAAKVYQVGVEAQYRVSQKFYLTASWVYSRQKETFGPPLVIPRNVVSVGFVLRYPTQQESSTEEG